MSTRLQTFMFLLAALATACGGSTTSGNAAMSVHLVDGPGTDYTSVLLDVRSVSIHGAGGWIVLGSPNKVIDLLSLTGGVAATLADGASLPAGHYDQMRLLLGPANAVTLADESTHSLKVPSGMQSGVKLAVSFDVAPGTTKDVFIDFDAHRSVFLHEAGASGKYLLRPVVRAVDRVVTGSITGCLTEDALVPLPLPGVTVTAQTVTGGVPTVFRTSLSRADGCYGLDLLPLDETYHVVAQPVVGSTVYTARASGGLALSPAAPTATQDLAFSATSALGTLSGHVTPVPGANESDLVSLIESLDVGAGLTQPLVVRSVPGAFDGTSETYAADHLPAVTYGVVVTRQGEDAAGEPMFATSASVSVTVAPPGSTLDLTAP